jgi:uncharacterized protein YeaO (DUF488 family)
VDIRIKRIHEAPSQDDGQRILVDRLWPRGFTKERARIDEWNKVLPPSNALRKSFHEERMDFAAFVKAYIRELKEQPTELDRLRTAARHQRVTLLYASANTEHNHARVLRDVLIGG